MTYNNGENSEAASTTTQSQCDLLRVRDSKVTCEKADGDSGNYHRFIKRLKNRLERRKAKHNPECLPSYGKYRGWES